MAIVPDTNDDEKHLADQSAFDRAMGKARAGDSEAVGEVLGLCRDYLLLIANQDMDRDLHRKMGASDLVQESMINAQKNFDRFEGATKQDFLAWLRGILKNDALHWRRHYKGVQKRGREQEAPLDGSHLPRMEPADSLYTPSTHAVAEEEEALLKRAIDELPQNYREIVRLRSFEDRSFVEIGEQLECSADAARKIWSRAIVRMQEVLARLSPPSESRLLPNQDEMQS